MSKAPIQNAKDIRLDKNPGNLPNVSGAILNYFIPLTFTKITKQTKRFQEVDVETVVNTQGVIQPLKPRELQMKPIGQRKWDWQQIHADINTPLQVDDIIVSANLKDGSTPYRIMLKNDYTLYGYVEYHVVQDYTS